MGLERDEEGRGYRTEDFNRSDLSPNRSAGIVRFVRVKITTNRASNITTNRSSDTRPEALLPQVTRDVKPATSNRYTKFQADAESRCILLGN